MRKTDSPGSWTVHSKVIMSSTNPITPEFEVIVFRDPYNLSVLISVVGQMNNAKLYELLERKPHFLQFIPDEICFKLLKTHPSAFRWMKSFHQRTDSVVRACEINPLCLMYAPGLCKRKIERAVEANPHCIWIAFDPDTHARVSMTSAYLNNRFENLTRDNLFRFILHYGTDSVQAVPYYMEAYFEHKKRCQ